MKINTDFVRGFAVASAIAAAFLFGRAYAAPDSNRANQDYTKEMVREMKRLADSTESIKDYGIKVESRYSSGLEVHVKN